MKKNKQKISSKYHFFTKYLIFKIKIWNDRDIVRELAWEPRLTWKKTFSAEVSSLNLEFHFKNLRQNGKWAPELWSDMQAEITTLYIEDLFCEEIELLQFKLTHSA